MVQSVSQVGLFPKKPAQYASPNSGKTAPLRGSIHFASMAGQLLMPLRHGITALEADPIKGLIFSDVGGMVLPRTGIEYKKRGIIPAQETFFREITGTITNTVLAGMLGFALLMGWNQSQRNRLAMDFKAWIDAPTLDGFGKIVREIVASKPGIKAGELQERFLDTALSRIQSSDGQFLNEEIRPFLPEHLENGKLKADSEPVRSIRDILLGRNPQYANSRAANIEEMALKRIQDEPHRRKIEEAVAAFKARFLKQRGAASAQKLTDAQWTQFVKEKGQLIERLKHEQYLGMRQKMTTLVRSTEGPSLDALYGMLEKAGLTESAYMHNSSGKIIWGVGEKSTRTFVRNIKHFMEEFLNRSLANPGTGKIESEAFVSSRMLERRMSALLQYSYNRKTWLVGVPMALTVGIGAAMVYINNWMTKRKLGGKEVFPGEVALMEGAAGKGASA